MISYELAKKLKKAGYPQHNAGGGLVGKVYNPTLSELIKSCGDKFMCLQKDTKPTRKQWLAISRIEYCCMGEGDNPKEAVANLWLGLNKKKMTEKK